MEMELSSSGSDVYKASNIQDNEELVQSKRHMIPLETALRLRKWTVGVSVFSVIVAFLLALIAFVIAVLQQSQALLAFGFESILDCFSSVVVLWRFQCFSVANKLYSQKRERIACLGLAVLFLCSAVAVFGIALHAVLNEFKPFKDDMLWYISVVNAVLCTGMSIAKFYLGRKLESRSVITDGVNSLIGAALSVAILISSLVYNHVNSHVWFLDSAISILCTMVLIAYGIKLLFDYIIEEDRKIEKESIVTDNSTGYNSADSADNTDTRH